MAQQKSHITTIHNGWLELNQSLSSNTLGSR